MKLKIIILIIVLIDLAGCTAGFVKPPAGSPTMADSYEAAVQDKTYFYKYRDSGKQVLSSKLKLPTISSNNAAIKYASVLDSQFPKLPNPENLMYIFGHFADQGEVPVPGHFITFTMYEKNHYALPNEIQTPFNDGQFMR